MLFTTRALLEAHQRNCEQDRDETQRKFNHIDERIKEIDGKINDMGDVNSKRHEDNIERFNQVKRIIWLVAGIGIGFSILKGVPLEKILRFLAG